MIKLTNILIYITHVCLVLGIMWGIGAASLVIGLFALPLAILASSPAVALWLMAVTAWNKYVKDVEID